LVYIVSLLNNVKFTGNSNDIFGDALEIFRSYCLKSLKNGRIMDWMKDISLEKAQKTILDEYKKFD